MQLGKMSLTQILAILVSLILSWVVATVVYRLYFHPLAKIPGPFWSRISGFPAYYHTLKRDRHVWCWCLQEQYGMWCMNHFHDRLHIIDVFKCRPNFPHWP